ncbi:Rmf/CrpP fold protein [Streptomyces sp. CS159]|nr:Rmf/CrpP fold protein [Streptomyces sp. CS159]
MPGGVSARWTSAGVLQGTAAGRRGDDVRTCPYPSDSVLRAAWVKG